MARKRNTPSTEGFGRSDTKTFRIPSGQTGAAVTAVDLERNYLYLFIRCADASGIPSSTTFGLRVGEDDSDALTQVYDPQGTGAWISESLPTVGNTYRREIPAAKCVQRVQIILSQVTTAPVEFQVWGAVESVRG